MLISVNISKTMSLDPLVSMYPARVIATPVSIATLLFVCWIALDSAR